MHASGIKSAAHNILTQVWGGRWSEELSAHGSADPAPQRASVAGCVSPECSAAPSDSLQRRLCSHLQSRSSVCKHGDSEHCTSFNDVRSTSRGMLSMLICPSTSSELAEKLLPPAPAAHYRQSRSQQQVASLPFSGRRPNQGNAREVTRL